MSKISDVIGHPNFLTLFRIAAVPVLVLLLLSTNKVLTFLSALVFSAAAITDYFDGYIARQKGLVSSFGKIMDPVADKLLISSAIIMLISHGWMPAWIGCVIIGREISITGLRNLIIKKGGDISASKLGKYKTGFQIAAIIPLLIHYPYFGIDINIIGQFFLWGALIFTIWSAIDYIIKFQKIEPFKL
ncbi:MAG: CDP-diacylglycerol--glycerol-3-phosphate 3-phosphatidyltransferase [Deltaproteobacteria bacterium]|nr:CDP-diacylglycerol--glycerol-3-phosphate 3-phosphatidyltransferase [Deltaproteobacteria bacterium]